MNYWDEEIGIMMNTPLTKRGAEKLQQQLEYLVQVRRLEIVAAIENARQHGDLKENSEYHAAKEEQAFLETQINKIESLLSRANIIDPEQLKNLDKVVFGATVTLESNKNKVTYKIVGEGETDFDDNAISIYAPLARALIGQKRDDVVQVKTQKGLVKYKILDIEYC